jgi:hypothetical protein
MKLVRNCQRYQCKVRFRLNVTSVLNSLFLAFEQTGVSGSEVPRRRLPFDFLELLTNFSAELIEDMDEDSVDTVPAISAEQRRLANARRLRKDMVESQQAPHSLGSRRHIAAPTEPADIMNIWVCKLTPRGATSEPESLLCFCTKDCLWQYLRDNADPSVRPLISIHMKVAPQTILLNSGSELSNFICWGEEIQRYERIQGRATELSGQAQTEGQLTAGWTGAEIAGLGLFTGRGQTLRPEGRTRGQSPVFGRRPEGEAGVAEELDLPNIAPGSLVGTTTMTPPLLTPTIVSPPSSRHAAVASTDGVIIIPNDSDSDSGPPTYERPHRAPIHEYAVVLGSSAEGDPLLRGSSSRRHRTRTTFRVAIPPVPEPRPPVPFNRQRVFRYIENIMLLFFIFWLIVTQIEYFGCRLLPWAQCSPRDCTPPPPRNFTNYQVFPHAISPYAGPIEAYCQNVTHMVSVCRDALGSNITNFGQLSLGTVRPSIQAQTTEMPAQLFRMMQCPIFNGTPVQKLFQAGRWDEIQLSAILDVLQQSAGYLKYLMRQLFGR